MPDPLRVLVVDDDRQLLRFIKVRLTTQGFVFRSATNGRAGLREALLWMPDVILLDYLMPDMDGLVFLEKLRGEPNLKSVPVVMLSANAAALQRKRALELGARFILSKPYEASALFEALYAAAKLGTYDCGVE